MHDNTVHCKLIDFSISESLTTSEHSSLENGLEVTKSARIKGITAHDISVYFRMCGNEVQVKLKPTTVPFSAYCIGEYGHVCYSTVL